MRLSGRALMEQRTEECEEADLPANALRSIMRSIPW